MVRGPSALGREVQSCTYIAYCVKKYNLAHILRIGEISTILCIYCALEKEVQSCANLAHILRIEEISKILCKSCALEKEEGVRRKSSDHLKKVKGFFV